VCASEREYRERENVDVRETRLVSEREKERESEREQDSG